MTTFKGNRKYPNPATVTDDPRTHTLALQQVIEALNVGQRRTRDVNNSFVRLHELVDVGLIEIVNGQLKLTNLGESVAAGASALADLTDVDLTGLADGDVLVWNTATSKWEPQAVSGGGGFTPSDMYDAALNDLADVAFYMPRDNDLLVYDASRGVWDVRDDWYPRRHAMDAPLQDPHPCNDEFDFGTDIDTAGARFKGARGWTVQRQSSGAVRKVENGCLTLALIADTHNFLAYMALPDFPSSNWEIVCRMARRPIGGDFDSVRFGISDGISDASPWNTVHWEWKYTSGFKAEFSKVSPSFSSLGITSAFSYPVTGDWIYGRFIGDSTTYNMDLSLNGVLWDRYVTRTIATDFPNGIKFLHIASQAANAGVGSAFGLQHQVAWDYIRVRQ